MWAQVDIRGSEKLAWLKYALRQKAARGDVVHQPLDGSGTGACGQVPALKDAAPPPRPQQGGSRTKLEPGKCSPPLREPHTE